VFAHNVCWLKCLVLSTVHARSQRHHSEPLPTWSSEPGGETDHQITRWLTSVSLQTHVNPLEQRSQTFPWRDR
jgi:hypothetical protein